MQVDDIDLNTRPRLVAVLRNVLLPFIRRDLVEEASGAFTDELSNCLLQVEPPHMSRDSYCRAFDSWMTHTVMAGCNEDSSQRLWHHWT